MQSRQNGSACDADPVQAIRIKPQRLEDGWSYLSGFYRRSNRRGREAWIRHQEDYVGVIVRKAAVLG